jgi:hypothetical protein
MLSKYKEIRSLPNDELSALIDKWIKGDVKRFVLKRHFIDCKTFEKIAEEADISAQTVKNIVYCQADYLTAIITAK